VKNIAFHCYRPGAVALSPFDAALLQILKAEKFGKVRGLTVRDMWTRFSFLPMSTFGPICGDTMPCLSRIRRSVARLKRSGLVARVTTSDSTPFRYVLKGSSESRNQPRDYVAQAFRSANA
jgi:hypothetical protein